jgi:hypothetical protein
MHKITAILKDLHTLRQFKYYTIFVALFTVFSLFLCHIGKNKKKVSSKFRVSLVVTYPLLITVFVSDTLFIKLINFV